MTRRFTSTGRHYLVALTAATLLTAGAGSVASAQGTTTGTPTPGTSTGAGAAPTAVASRAVPTPAAVSSPAVAAQTTTQDNSGKWGLLGLLGLAGLAGLRPRPEPQQRTVETVDRPVATGRTVVRDDQTTRNR